ncbi:universal stress protein [Yoonia sp. MH D7]
MTHAVLCAVDVSNGNEDIKTLQTAAKLAELEGAQLDVIGVVPDYGMAQVGTFFNKAHHDQMLKEAKVQLNKIVTTALGAEQNLKVRHLISSGRAYEEVLKVAKKSSARLIVVGAHKADFKDYLLGPNAARIVRHATCSVYVVR